MVNFYWNEAHCQGNVCNVAVKQTDLTTVNIMKMKTWTPIISVARKTFYPNYKKNLLISCYIEINLKTHIFIILYVLINKNLIYRVESSIWVIMSDTTDTNIVPCGYLYLSNIILVQKWLGEMKQWRWYLSYWNFSNTT